MAIMIINSFALGMGIHITGSWSEVKWLERVTLPTHLCAAQQQWKDLVRWHRSQQQLKSSYVKTVRPAGGFAVSI